MKALRILYLEDIPDHVELVTAAMQPQFPGTHVENVSAVHDAVACLQNRQYDVVLTSATLHGNPVIPHLHEVLADAKTAPLIVLSGEGDEKLAANAIKHGAIDYLVKSRESLEVLPYLIQRLLKKRRHPAAEAHSTQQSAHPPDGVNHLMAEIEHVSQRIHSLQESSHVSTVISSLREELRLLRQYAEGLVESRKSGKVRA